MLFSTTQQHTAAAPQLALSLDYVKLVFAFYFRQMLVQHDKQGTLAFVCGLLIVFAFLSSLFRYL